MFGFLFWLFSLLAGIALVGLLWRIPRRADGRRRLLFPVAATFVLLVLAGGIVSLCAVAESAGYRPSRLGAAIAWTVLLAAGGVAAASLGRKSPWLSPRKLAAAVALGALFSLGAYLALDWSRRSECERRIAEAEAALEDLKPSPLPEGQDARPAYERAFGLLGEEKDWPEWIWSQRAMEGEARDLRAFLDSKQEALSAARKARSLTGYTVEFPAPLFSLEGVEAGAEPTRFSSSLARLAKIIRLRCLLSAKEGDFEGVQGQIGWLGDLLRQMSRETLDLSIVMAQGMAEMRVGLLEESLALLGTSAYLPRVPFPAVPDGAVEAQLSRCVLANSQSAIRDLARFFRGKSSRLWRVVFLPIDLHAILRYQALAGSARLLPGESSGLVPAGRSGRGPHADRVIFRLEHAARAVRRAMTAERIASAGQEVHTFRAKNGKYPARLAELVPGQLREIPVDARFGRPIEYRELDGGAVVFSVWDGESDVPMEDLGGSSGVPPAWARILRTDERLVFFLGAAREKWRPPREADDGLR
jgi:hypothetical protein